MTVTGKEFTRTYFRYREEFGDTITFVRIVNNEELREQVMIEMQKALSGEREKVTDEELGIHLEENFVT